MKPSSINPVAGQLRMMDIARRKRCIVVRLATDTESLAVLMEPAEAYTVGQALTEYAQGA